MADAFSGNGPGVAVKGGRALRRGYTTGSCATAAAVAAAELLLGGGDTGEVAIALPGGARAIFSPEVLETGHGFACCGVRKDAGDDPDVTDGLVITARCELAPKGIVIRGGEGVGVVTAPGLSVPVGQAAINPIPRQMAAENLTAVCRRHGYTGGLLVTISVPGGREAAAKTFNPRLGITGGLSILGTTGIVEPMSEAAVIETIKMLIDKHCIADSEAILITPGNYGQRFCREVLGIDTGLAVKCGNYLGETLDYATYRRFRRILLVGHAGKLLKVAGGIMNTHSAAADCRLEIITAHAACAGADLPLCRELMRCRTTEAALDLLHAPGREPLKSAVCASLLENIMKHLHNRLGRGLAERSDTTVKTSLRSDAAGPSAEVIVFSGETILLQSPGAARLAARFAGGAA